MKIWANEKVEKVVYNTIVNTNVKLLIYSGNVYFKTDNIFSMVRNLPCTVQGIANEWGMVMNG